MVEYGENAEVKTQDPLDRSFLVYGFAIRSTEYGALRGLTDLGEMRIASMRIKKSEGFTITTYMRFSLVFSSSAFS